MKKRSYFLIFFLSVIGFLLIITTSFFNNKTKEVKTLKNSKILIVYYSRTGNTKTVAELIQGKVGGDLEQIETKETRPSNYKEEVEQNEIEQNQNILPKLKNKIENFDSYDTIFIGAPTWNMGLPQAVVSFLKDYNFNNKDVIPFNTNGGYGPGNSFSQIKSEARGANIKEGFSVKGGEENKDILLSIKGEKREKVLKEVDLWLKKVLN
ncbi:flavodoxin [Lactococcus lactis]|uniref:flavodoxin n=1 Tax=Lactococcus lactis TaxID=1358 RepID=UPI001914BE42|nr:flavodoxin [Lactococcus lactis]WDA70058.1 flavodoxin [Lactococcus lactis]